MGTGGVAGCSGARAGGAAAGATGVGTAAPGNGIAVAVAGAGTFAVGSAGAGGAASGAGACTRAAVCGAAGAGVFAGGVAQAHNAAHNQAVRNSGSRCMREESEKVADRLVDASGVALQEFPPGALYVVATPIGNLADLTVRAWWVLSHVDAIAAEDTRVTRHLLERYRIDIDAARLIAAHEHNERATAGRIVALLRAGARVALVSDAGTPAISDPGARIVHAVRAAALRVIPVPGPSSVTAALSIAGLERGPVLLVGFLPASARERARVLQWLATSDAAAVLFEAPHRLRATAAALAAALAPARRILIARELTKKFESVESVTAGDLPAHVAQSEPRGEYVLVIEPVPPAPPALELDATTRRWLDALAAALPPARAAAIAAQATGLDRAPLYRELARARAGGGSEPGEA
jgi:16S rRNA (cytidine1402-2'-O)-methyltransferase